MMTRSFRDGSASLATVTVLFMTLCGQVVTSPPDTPVPANAWRVVNAEHIEFFWRVRSLQFFSDLECTKPLDAAPNFTGDAIGTDAAEMTGPEYVFSLRTMRGWESLEHCAVGDCHLGFVWYKNNVNVVQCVMLEQGEEGTHAPSLTLQQRGTTEGGAWVDVTTWRSVDPGRAKLALSCPSVPGVAKANIEDCRVDSHLSQECRVRCDEGFGTTESRLRCINGVWYLPECMPVGSMMRLVANAPELIKPYWVILHAVLYENEDCTNVIRMNGQAMSSGEYVIKYASYHPRNAWDGDSETSWAAREPCTPGSCWMGFRFRKSPPAVRCVKIEHPHGTQYQATEVSLQNLGPSGWENVDGVEMRLLPEQHLEL